MSGKHLKTHVVQHGKKEPVKPWRHMLCPVLFLLVMNWTTAQAQDEMQEEEIEEIYVYGQHIDRSLQDTQTSVSVVTGEQLNRASVTDLYEIVDRTAGVSQQGGGFGFVIRGIPTGGVGGGTGATVDVTVDGASLPPGQSVYTGALSVWDPEQVESEKYGVKFTYSLPELAVPGLVPTLGLDINRDATAQVLVRSDREWVPETTLTGYAPFVQINKSFAERWHLSAGYRYEFVELDVDDFTTTEIEGFEIAGGININENLYIDGNYARLDGRYDSDRDGTVDTNLDGLNIAPNRLNMFIEADAFGWLSGRLRVSCLFAREFEGPGARPNRDFGGFTVADLVLTANSGLGNFEFGIDNITDNQYLTYFAQGRSKPTQTGPY